MKTSPIRLKQKLSPKAAAAKKKRDLASALTKKRADYKASSQRARRKAIKKGIDVRGKDYDHRTASFKSVKSIFFSAEVYKYLLRSSSVPLTTVFEKGERAVAININAHAGTMASEVISIATLASLY